MLLKEPKRKPKRFRSTEFELAARFTRFNDLHDGLTPGENGSTDSSVLAPVWRCPSHFRFITYSRHSLGGSGGPKSADCVEEVCELAMLDPTMRPAHGCLIVPKRAGAQGSGSALRASGGSGPWQQGGTRLEHPTGLLT